MLSRELEFDNPPPLEQDLSDFKIVLKEGRLEVIMKREVQTEVEARTAVEPNLRSWELDHFLSVGRREFWFEFNNSVIIDKSPTPPGDKVVHVGLGEFILTSDEVLLKLTKKMYPVPNFSLSTTPDVETLVTRYEGFTKKKEPLLSMAYFCLTVMVAGGGNLKDTARKFNIQKEVFKKLGELTSKRGDLTESRKAKDRTSFESLTAKEIDWITVAIRKLIRRKAEYDHDPNGSYSVIDLAGLPNLSESNAR